jgi:hypothetical protein
MDGGVVFSHCILSIISQHLARSHYPSTRDTIRPVQHVWSCLPIRGTSDQPLFHHIPRAIDLLELRDTPRTSSNIVGVGVIVHSRHLHLNRDTIRYELHTLATHYTYTILTTQELS